MISHEVSSFIEVFWWLLKVWVTGVPGFALCSTTPKTPPGFRTAKVLEKISSILGPSQLCKFLNVKTASTLLSSASLSNKNVVNLGFGANGPLLEYATYVEYGRELKAKKVLWFVYIVISLRMSFDSVVVCEFQKRLESIRFAIISGMLS